MRKLIVFMLINLAVPLFASAMDTKTPPSSAIIYQTLEQLWSDREYDKLTSYIETLEHSFGEYVPFQIARAMYSYKYGAQVEDAIDRLSALQSGLQANIATASPVFMELLDSRILRYQRTRMFYLQEGVSREKRLADRNPLAKTEFKHSEHWGEEMLFFNAPEVFLAGSGVKSAVITGRDAILVQAIEKVPVETLQAEVGDDKKPMIERKVFAQELVLRRGTDGGVSNLVRSLRAGDSPYTYQYTVEELAKVGPTAIPALVEFINDPAHFSPDQKMAIWALVRIGVIDPTIIHTLQTISANTERLDLAKYAQDALRYLQERGRKGSGQ